MEYSSLQACLTFTGTHMPHRITPSGGDILAFPSAN